MTLQTLIKYFFGSIIILFIFWNRFLRDRENASLISIPNELLIILDISIILFFVVIFYINIKRVTKNNKQSKLMIKVLQYSFVQNILFNLREYIFKSPEFLYEEVTRGRDLEPYLEKPASYFTVYCNYPRMIVICFIEIPFLIVAVVFLVSNVYFHNITIFFKSLVILIPMLLMRVWLFIVISYSTRRLNHVYQFITATYINSTQQFKLELKPDNQLPTTPEFPIDRIKAQFPVLCNFWEIYSSIYSFMKRIESYRNQYDPYIQIFTSLCYIIGWIFIIFVNK